MQEVIVQGATGFNLFKFIWKHLYIIILILFTIPLIISTINQSIEERNPALPLLSMGMDIFNADTSLYNFVEKLETNPSEIIGMEKPTTGIYIRFVYYSKYLYKVIWKILGFFVFLAIPFVLVYKLLKIKDSSSAGKNILFSVLISVIFMFFMNLIITVHGLIRGTLALYPPSTNLFDEFLWIIMQTLPFHGLISLITYLIKIIAG